MHVYMCALYTLQPVNNHYIDWNTSALHQQVQIAFWRLVFIISAYIMSVIRGLHKFPFWPQLLYSPKQVTQSRGF